MSRALIAWAGLGWLLSIAGCTLANLTPQSRFSDATFELNDAARWGQLDIASERVAPEYRARFLARRRGWSEGVSIAEADVVHMRIDREKDRAYSVVNVSWMNDGITLRKSVIAQTWKSDRSHFWLSEETIKSGDPALFATP
jgi:hypothetical protein